MSQSDPTLPAPTTADLARDAAEDMADCEEQIGILTTLIAAGGSQSPDLAYLVRTFNKLHTQAAWIRRAVAAEAARDELRKRVAELETRLYDLWECENQAKWDDYEKRHGL